MELNLDYGSQLSPMPILLSIGSLRKPKINDIFTIGFDKFTFYEALIKMTPKLFYTMDKQGETYWNSLTEEEQDEITLYQVILKEKELRDNYIEIFNFFFVEPVMFIDGYFVLLNKNIESINDINFEEDIRGLISENIFMQLLELLQRVCGIYNEEEKPEKKKFKNKIAKQLYEKIQKAEKEKKKREQANIDYSLPNIISAVCAKHPSINFTNVGELTIFQLLDSFNRLQVNAIYEIDSTRVSVWGDEKKTFNPALWYKNEFDKKDKPTTKAELV